VSRLSTTPGVWKVWVPTLFLASCSRAAPPPPQQSLGEVMVQVGRRFEVAGRACLANRFALAEFEVQEIEELFDEGVPRATLPKGGPTAHIPTMAKGFRMAQLPDLEKAAASSDRPAFTSAFERAAAVCNACHQASAKAFIQVSSEPGKFVPDLDALPTAHP
jgi:hypothetical protein